MYEGVFMKVLSILLLVFLSLPLYGEGLSKNQVVLCNTLKNDMYGLFLKKSENRELDYPYPALYQAVNHSLEEHYKEACGNPAGMDSLIKQFFAATKICFDNCDNGASAFFTGELFQKHKKEKLSKECRAICEQTYTDNLRQVALSYWAYSLELKEKLADCKVKPTQINQTSRMLKKVIEKTEETPSEKENPIQQH